MPQLQQIPDGSDFAQGAIGLGQGLLAGMQLKQSLDIERQRADMMRAQLLEERRSRQVYEGQRQQQIDMQREEFGMVREDRQRRRDSEAGLVETALGSLERMLAGDPATEDLLAEIGVAKTRLAPEHLRPYMEQIQAEIEMRQAPLAAEQMAENLTGLVERGVIDKGQAQQWQEQMQRYVESSGADGLDPDAVGEMADQARGRMARITSTQRQAEETAAFFDQYVAQMPTGSLEQTRAKEYQEQIRLALDPEEIAKLRGELNRVITGEADEEWAMQMARQDASGSNFLDAREKADFLDDRAGEYMDRRRGRSMLFQGQGQAKGATGGRSGPPGASVSEEDKEALRQALMQALGGDTNDKAPRKPGRKTDQGGGFLDTLGGIGKAIGGGGAKAAQAIGEGVSGAADRASMGRRSRGSRKPAAASKPKPEPKGTRDGVEDLRRSLAREEARLKDLRASHPEPDKIKATKAKIAELKAALKEAGK